MEQTFVEVLVTRKRNMAAGMLKIACGILAVFCFLLSFLNFYFLAGILVFGALACYGYLQEWVEYEYSYVCRELSIDKIVAKSRRKHVADYQIDGVEIGAMEDSYRLDGYKNKNCTVKDYSSKNNEKKFILYYEGNIKLVLEPDEKLLKALRMAAPGKVIL